jgi:hypothetical protein
LKLPAKFRFPPAAALACGALSVLPLALGCAARATPPAPTAADQASPLQPVSGPGPHLDDKAWGVLRSKTLGVKLAVPDVKGWTEPPGRSPQGAAWQLSHTATGTRLNLYRWRASRLPRVEACDTELRQRVPGLVTPDETNLVATREVRVPQGFVTRITLLALPGKGPRFQGQTLAVGAGIGECLAAVAITEASSELELAERLRLLDAALGHLRLSHIEDRVPAPPPVSP